MCLFYFCGEKEKKNLKVIFFFYLSFKKSFAQFFFFNLDSVPRFVPEKNSLKMMRFVYHKIKTFTVGQTLVCVCVWCGRRGALFLGPPHSKGGGHWAPAGTRLAESDSRSLTYNPLTTVSLKKQCHSVLKVLNDSGELFATIFRVANNLSHFFPAVELHFETTYLSFQPQWRNTSHIVT